MSTFETFGFGQAYGAAKPSVFPTSMDNLSERTQLHLFKVYSALTATVVAATAGAFFQMSYGVDGFLTTLGMFGVMFAILSGGSSSQASSGKFDPMRAGLLLLFGFLQGISVGSLVEMTLYIDPAIPVSAFLATCAVFASFTAVSLMSKRRSYLYLGATLGSALSWLLLASFVNLFFRSMVLFDIGLYVGLGVFCGYVVYDTQVIVEKVELFGDQDYVKHAMELFVDFIAIFVRILIIMAKNAEKQEQRSRRRANRR